MNTKVIAAILFIFLAVIGGLFWQLNQNSNSSQSNIDGKEKSFNLTVENFAYTPESVDVNLNDTVVLNITNRDNVRHGISLPVFGVNSFVNPNSSTTVRFVADQTGNPETFCSTDHGEKILINVKG